MSADQTAAILGSTGLIGGHITAMMKNDTTFSTIRLISRRPLDSEDERFEVVVIDFENEREYRDAIEGVDVLFCSVGTTNKNVKGDKDAYRKVDFDIPVNGAQIGSEAGLKTFLLVSAVGADSGSGVFYSRLKGEVEDAVKELPIPSIHIFQPSILLGDRKEFRLGERIGQFFMQAVSFLTPSKYRPIHARAVAKAMITVSQSADQGVHIHQYKEMKALAE